MTSICFSVQRCALVAITLGAALNVGGIARAQPCAPQTYWLAAEGEKGLGGVVNAIAPLGGGDAIAVGQFTNTGGGLVPLANVARWTEATQSWSSLGQGILGTGNAVVVLPNGDLIVGGAFTNAGGVAANNIARWNSNSQTFSAIGSGVTGQAFPGQAGVSAMAQLPGGDIVVVGPFTSAGVPGTVGIARLNPTTSTWSAFGSGVSGLPTSVAVTSAGDVYVGGFLTNASGTPVSGVAKWTAATSSWSALGSGIARAGVPIAFSLCALPGGDVIVGGDFTSAGGVPCANVARWNAGSSTWSALGTGFNGRVFALTHLSSSNLLLAGGQFTTADGQPASRVAQRSLSGGGWSEFAGGTNGEVRALASVSGQNVLAGGDFVTAGPNQSVAWARTTFGVPAPSIATQPVAGSVCIGDITSISVYVQGAAPRTYQWRRNGVPIDSQETGNPTAATSGLTIQSVQLGDLGSYDCVVTNDCGTVTSNATVLALRPDCPCGPSDVAGSNQSIGSDGQLNADDIIVFLSWYFGFDGRADIAGSNQSPQPDGQFSADDIIVFLSRYFTGC